MSCEFCRGRYERLQTTPFTKNGMIGCVDCRDGKMQIKEKKPRDYAWSVIYEIPIHHCPMCGDALSPPQALSLEELRERDDQLIYAVVPCVFDEQLVIPSLVAYDPESDDGDEVYLTNNQGGRSSFDDCVAQGMAFYDRPPKEDHHGVD